MEVMIGKAKVQVEFNQEALEYKYQGIPDREGKPYNRTVKVASLQKHVQDAAKALGYESEAACRLVADNFPSGQDYQYTEEGVGMAVSSKTSKLSIKPNKSARFPLTTSKENWRRILKNPEAILAFIDANEDSLK